MEVFLGGIQFMSYFLNLFPWVLGVFFFLFLTLLVFHLKGCMEFLFKQKMTHHIRFLDVNTLMTYHKHVQR